MFPQCPKILPAVETLSLHEVVSCCSAGSNPGGGGSGMSIIMVLPGGAQYILSMDNVDAAEH